MAGREEREGRGDEVIAGERTFTDIATPPASAPTVPQRNTTARQAPAPPSPRSQVILREVRAELIISQDQRDKAEDRVKFLETQLGMFGDEGKVADYRGFQTLQEELDVTRRQRDNAINETASEKQRADGYLDRIRELEQGR